MVLERNPVKDLSASRAPVRQGQGPHRPRNESSGSLKGGLAPTTVVYPERMSDDRTAQPVAWGSASFCRLAARTV